MAGRLIDLADSATALPDRLIFDSSVIIDWLLAVASEPTSPLPLPHQQARDLVERMQDQGGIGLITSTSLSEIYHFLVKAEFRNLLPQYGDDVRHRFPQVRHPTWSQLFKVRPELIRQFLPKLDAIQRFMVQNDLLVLQPRELAPIRQDRSLEDELLRTMTRYALDSADAAIVMEARRAGVMNLVTSDRDLWRTSLDMDVYTWQIIVA